MLRKAPLKVLGLAGFLLLFTATSKAAITQAIDENKLVTLAGNTRSEATRQYDAGPVESDLHLDMYLQLKRSPEQELAAKQFVESLTDKSSPNFHKWITAAEYGERFGAASEDVATVSRWLELHGFTVNGVPANRMVIDFSGSAGQVREALHTDIHYVNVGGTRYFANMSDPRIPAALLPAVTGVVSLNSFTPHPMLVPRAEYTVNPQQLLLVPGDVATIYNLTPAFSAGYTGQGQTIVVVEDTNLYNGTGDWKAFRTTFGLDQYAGGSLTQVHPAGAGGACNDPGVSGDDAEAAIDVEWASAAAPNAAIVMASCKNTTTFGGFIALQNLLTNGGPLPSAVSISYGESETQTGAALNSYINTLYQTAAAAGVSVFVASGDAAAAAADRGGNEAIYGINVSGWASTIYNVAVGGTDFGDFAAGTSATFWNPTNGTYYESAKSYVPEIPWNDSCGSAIAASFYGYATSYGAAGLCNAYPDLANTVGGSGGPSGCATGARSIDYAVSGTCAGYDKPSWQWVFGNPSDGVRDLPDVSLFAANGMWGHYYVVCFSDGASCAGAPSTWAGFGGTSVSSPIMAGIQAVINQALGSKNAGNPNPVYYDIAQSEYGTAAGRTACNSTSGPASTCAFNDITQGDMVLPCAGAFNCYLDGEALGVLSTSDTSYEPAYAATAGWDFATGIGSVNAFNLLNAFVNSTTPSSVPAAPVLVSPANGATGVPPETSLTWYASTGAASYDVYFGTASTPPQVTNTANFNYAPGTLIAATTYYWAVGARNNLGANASTAWSFTTSCVSALNPSGATAPLAGGTGTIPVAATPGCAWTAVSNTAWITITSGASGSASGTVGYTAAASTGVVRAGTITVAGQTFTVTQAGIYPLISTLAGGAMPSTPSPGASVSIPVSNGVAHDSSGNTYFTSPSLNAVFRADPSGALTRIAGTGTSGYAGDGGAALNAQLNAPNGVAVDTLGNLYIADSSNNVVRKVDGSGNIVTVVGNGSYGYSGDGGVATSAQLADPYGVAVDTSEDLYIADTYNNRIREVNAAGTITTVAGTGSYGYSGDNGLAIGARLWFPNGVAVSAPGNLYIADTYNLRVRMVSRSGTITTVAGTGSYGFSGDGGAATSARLAYPNGVGVDASGNFYIGDTNNNRIRKVTAAGIITTVAGNGSFGYTGDGGAATGTRLASPEGVAVDATGNLYITDSGNARVREVNAAGSITTLVGGAVNDGGLSVFGLLNQPSGVTRDNAGNTYIADTNNNRVRKVAADGSIATVAGTGISGFAGDGAAATLAELNAPMGLALDAAGDLYISDSNNSRIRKVDGSGNITTVAGNGLHGYLGDSGAAISAQIGIPCGIALDSVGNLYISDISNSVIRKVATSGIISTVAGTGSNGYSGDGGAATSAKLYGPYDVAVDVAGNLYIADTNNLRIRMVSTSGIMTTVAGNGSFGSSGDGGAATSAQLAYPSGVAVDASGNLYIADSGNERVREVNAAGIITTVAGNGTYGYSGDGGLATGAALRFPFGVFVDGAGNVAVADQASNAVRLLTPEDAGPVLTIQSAHPGSFTQGQDGATYTVTVSNGPEAGPTGGVITVSEILPGALSLVTMTGSGWTCSAPAAPTCTRSDALSGGSSYPAITVKVNVAAAAQSQLTNEVSVSGGGANAAGAKDLTVISASGAPGAVAPGRRR
jgi:sugar lactone lactonase YvrE